MDISTSILQHIPAGVFGIVNIRQIHEHCEHRYIYITAYSPRGYDVNSHVYWAASHQRYKGNLTKCILCLKPPRFFLFLLPTHSIGP
jgi:hypothetical protein